MATHEFKLKDLTKLDLQPGEKREVEVEGVENGKVLLVQVGDKTHAVGPKCTHYGAPLKNGVVTPEGRLTCPWHGACFKVSTGDIEDSPAPDPIATFGIAEKTGAVYITGDEKTIQSGRVQPNMACSVTGSEKVVIVGGGSGCFGALSGLRTGGFKGQITVISLEPYPPIDRTKLSKALLTDVSKLTWRPKEYWSGASIDLINDEVTKVDFASKSVTTKKGAHYPYTKLVLATGGVPNQLPLPGFKELDNIFLLRTVPDAEAIVSAVGDNGKKIVVIGSSFIGMEISNCLAQKGNTVTCVGQESAPMERVMGTKVGKIFQSLLEKNGVKFKLGAAVDKATPSSNNSKSVGAVHLKDGTDLEADLVVLGIGVKPATGFLKDAKEIELLKDGSLKTDESFAVTGLQDVYAIGDIASYPYHGPGGDGELTRIEHWNVAQNAGRSVANSIAHPGAKPKPFIPVFWSALGSQLRYCGNTHNGYDDVVIKGEPEQAKFVAYYTRGETVVAVASMQMDPIMTKSAELMRRDGMPSKSEIEKGVNPLDLSVPSGVKI
ncbi:rubredoxin-NAD(+) reductase [Xylona heveae TC161]|uniref:Rubredoxin-NAD(+) reductase n=1 Tax=Xylona heveae (strain CBS 132557 / TC161) TaxID=1328760 RepID=A0A165I2L1_XYLHT|nr:rubredoxin-NAD(+) reductase [Xylona heveae TC161]KZF24280.1 rubredoxin-NAD(+) reductase [Xylona heveae TC161]